MKSLSATPMPLRTRAIISAAGMLPYMSLEWLSFLMPYTAVSTE
jgi:hypothetical protein